MIFSYQSYHHTGMSTLIQRLAAVPAKRLQESNDAVAFIVSELCRLLHITESPLCKNLYDAAANPEYYKNRYEIHVRHACMSTVVTNWDIVKRNNHWSLLKEALAKCSVVHPGLTVTLAVYPDESFIFQWNP